MGLKARKRGEREAREEAGKADYANVVGALYHFALLLMCYARVEFMYGKHTLLASSERWKKMSETTSKTILGINRPVRAFCCSVSIYLICRVH